MMSTPAEQRIAQNAYAEMLRSTRIADREMAAALRDAAREAERIIASSIDDSVSAQVRRAQFNQSAQALREAQAEMWGTATRATQAAIDRSSAAAARTNVELLQILERAVPGRGQELMASLQAATRTHTEALRSRLIHNRRLSDQVWKTSALANRWVDRKVNRGLALGKSAREIASDVRHMIRPDTPGGVSYAAKRLARTEINNAYHTTQVLTAQELPWTEGMKWNLSGSHPKPDICDDFADADDYRLGAGVYPPNAVPEKPHPNCLCYVVTEVQRTDVFINNLLQGGFDDWLMGQGMTPMVG
jgi:hypothetical protein